MNELVMQIAGATLRGLLPYPDLPRRLAVRRRAWTLATSVDWPRDESDADGDSYARLALLRLLELQRATRRAVQTRQRESSALLARTAMETCILGLWCLHEPTAADKLRASELRNGPLMLTFLSSAGLVPQDLIRQAVGALGEPGRLPDVRSMAQLVDSKTGASLGIHLYDAAYRPASHYFTHATGAALLRHVTADYRYSAKPAKSWARRAPVRLADACVGVLAAAIADRIGNPAQVRLFARYAENHADRVLPPMLVTTGKALAGRVNISAIRTTFREARMTKSRLELELSQDQDSGEREARVRSMFVSLTASLGVEDLPPESVQPVLDFLVKKVLDGWATEHANRSSTSAGTSPLHEA
ncbi:hypothetical protein [Actinoplanes sp. NBRC 103695]|uniref:hypothetical protein n=1 Tax=Actinoplanes sp. NBRC 103695 TaxID=3032202 RepID=UPI0025563A0E|nr:hypothetical protein [Actinoplanes sp. NBRC 103695]